MGLEMDGIQDVERDLIAALLPGLGFFGNTPETTLTVPIGGSVDVLELAIEAPAAEILNISEIKFIGADGEVLDREALCSAVELSSIYGEKTAQQCFKDFLAGQLLHTRIERRPAITIRLKSLTALREIRICNRGDIYGARSRFVVVSAFARTDLVTRFENLTAKKVREDLAKLMGKAGDASISKSGKELLPFLAGVRRQIVRSIEADVLDLDGPHLFQLLPMFDANPEVAEFHFSVLAHLVLTEWRGRSVVDTSFLRPFSRMLSTDLSIERLRVELERLLEKRLGRNTPVVISRHHIHESQLVSRREEFLKALDKTVSILAGEGITGMLGYGTLLGAVRDQGFMPHDDDVDLITFDGSFSQYQAQAGKRKIIDALKAHGADARESGYWHLQAVVDGIVVDLFPVWQDGDDLFMPMEQLKIRAVPARHVLPAGVVALYDRVYPAPASPEAFLADRYGEGWRFPDPYYEWPWRIDQVLTGW